MMTLLATGYTVALDWLYLCVS